MKQEKLIKGEDAERTTVFWGLSPSELVLLVLTIILVGWLAYNYDKPKTIFEQTTSRPFESSPSN